MTRLVAYICFILLCQCIFISANVCLHNEPTKCTQVENGNDYCQHLCIQTGHASGHCSLASNCFQYCLCNEKDL